MNDNSTHVATVQPDRSDPMRIDPIDTQVPRAQNNTRPIVNYSDSDLSPRVLTGPYEACLKKYANGIGGMLNDHSYRNTSYAIAVAAAYSGAFFPVLPVSLLKGG
ncbi:hypothetical protein BD410DRAFT_80483 [Rickenella mellea]|uniref:Uncharacterized protein n=1 Tax=Rickenella mellea TaxID=50990 RepID=A0A4Y7PLM5_9AGAM|nr:hypothetical protein BD410DRAFT_80483 [Rickenella mellea]